MAHSISQLTTGPPGTGKSYNRVSLFLITEFLPDRTGTFYTNVNLGRVPTHHPFKPEFWQDSQGRTRKHTSFIRRICNEAAKRYGGDPNDYAKRVRRIPPSLCDEWRKPKATSGPWDFFRGKDLSGAHVQLDEIHNFCPKNGERNRPQMYMEWLGEIRHTGATVEFMTQHLHKLNPKIENECGFRRTLTDMSDLRDPLFGIPIGHWWEVKTILTGTYDRKIVVNEKIRRDEGWKVTHRYKFSFKPEYFAFYNSHEAPQKGGKAGKEDKKQWERRSKPGLAWWFFKRYPLQLSSRAAIGLFALWFCFLGGGNVIMGLFLEWFMVNLAGGPAQASEPDPPALVEVVDEPVDEPIVESFTSVEALPAVVEDVAVVDPVDGEFISPDPVDPQMQQELLVLRQQLAVMEASREEYVQRAEQLAEVRRAGSALVMLTPTEATFKNGYTYKIGELIDYGDYEGSTITGINYERRSITIDETIILRMGRDDTVLGDDVVIDDDWVPITPEPAADPDDSTVIRGSIRATPEQPAESAGDDVRGTDLDAVGRGHAADPLPAVGE